MKFKSCDECPAKVLCKNTSRVDWGYGGLECVKFLNDMESKLHSHNKSSPKFSESFKEMALSWFVDEEGDQVAGYDAAEEMFNFIVENFGR